MNLQALMKQAQSMQKNMLQQKKEIESKKYEGESELVKIVMNGKREVISVKIKNLDAIESDDIEALEDMIMIATNNAISKINDDINKKMGNQVGAFGDLI